MDEYGRNDRKMRSIVFIVIVVELALIAGVIVAMANMIIGEKKTEGISEYGVRISNFRQEIPTKDRDGLDNIRFSIYDIVWLNNMDVDKNDIIDVTIRTNSVESVKFEEDNIMQVNFIVDLPDMGQSFHINYVYSTVKWFNKKLPIEYRTMAYCLEESQRTNSDWSCRDRYAGQAEDIIQSFDFL